jgi:PIN domain nuclease of toxin-antitoxin system
MERAKQPVVHLDTHIVLWLSFGTKNLSQKAVYSINKAPQVCIAPIVELELQYLLEIKRIREQPTIVIETLEKDIGLKISNADSRQVIKISKDIYWTRDVFDRLIVAEAIATHAMLVTKDKRILAHFDHALW